MTPPLEPLYDYQERAVAWLHTRKRGMVVAPAGAGKTRVASGAIDRVCQAKPRDRKVRVGWMANTIEQCTQAEKAIANFPALASLAEFRIACAASNTDWTDRDVLVGDECFTAGTIVAGRPIETICVGDKVQSWNHATQTVELRRVVRLFKSTPSVLVTVVLSGGRRVTCTPSHPFWNGLAYVPAASLTSVDVVHTITQHENSEMPSLRNDSLQSGSLQRRSEAGLRKMPSAWREAGIGQGGVFGLCGMREVRGVQKQQRGILSKTLRGSGGNRVLLEELQEDKDGKDFLRNDGKNESSVCIESDENEQSDEATGNPREATRNPSRDGVEASSSWRERLRANCATVVARILSWLENGSDSKDGWGIQAEPLQVGYCKRDSEGCRGGGRVQSSSIEDESRRCKEGFLLGATRVEAVEVHKPTSDGTFGGLCPNGVVFNLEVEGNNNYFAGGVLVHNCHHLATAPQWQEQVGRFTGAFWGFTATPPEDPDKLDVLMKFFDGHRFDIPREEVQSRLVQARVITLHDTDVGLRETIDREIDAAMAYRRRYWHPGEIAMCRRILADSSASGERKAAAVAMMEKLEGQLWGQVAFQKCVEFGIVRNETRTRAAVAKAVQHSRDSVVMLVNHVDHAKVIAEMIPGAVACFSKMGAKKRRETLAGFAAGDIPCIIATSLLDEGWDCQRANVLVLVSAGRSNARTEQRTGRVLRSFAGKTAGLIYDFDDRFHPLAAKHSRVRHDLYRRLGYTV